MTNNELEKQLDVFVRDAVMKKYDLNRPKERIVDKVVFKSYISKAYLVQGVNEIFLVRGTVTDLDGEQNYHLEIYQKVGEL